MPPETIILLGQRWQIASATKNRIVLSAICDDADDLKAWRSKRDLTQRAAAERLGISQALVANIERGNRRLPATARAKMR